MPGLTSALAGKADASDLATLETAVDNLDTDAIADASSLDAGSLTAALEALATALGGKQAAATALSNLVALAATITPGQAVIAGASAGDWEAADMGGGVDVGDYKHSFAEEAPPGWLPCDGAILLQSVYPDLYAALEPGFPAVVTGELTFDQVLADLANGSSYTPAIRKCGSLGSRGAIPLITTSHRTA